MTKLIFQRYITAFTDKSKHNLEYRFFLDYDQQHWVLAKVVHCALLCINATSNALLGPFSFLPTLMIEFNCLLVFNSRKMFHPFLDFPNFTWWLVIMMYVKGSNGFRNKRNMEQYLLAELTFQSQNSAQLERKHKREISWWNHQPYWTRQRNLCGRTNKSKPKWDQIQTYHRERAEEMKKN